MSLTEEIVRLTEASETLTQTIIDKEAVINQTLEEGMADLPSHMHKISYVDGQFGNDDTGNGFSSTPYKTIKKAIDNAPETGVLRINLLGEENEAYTLSEEEKVIIVRSTVSIRPYLRSDLSLQRQAKIIFPWYQDSQDNYYPARFYYDDFSNPSIAFYRIDLEIEAEPSGQPLGSSEYLAIISGSLHLKQGVIAVNISTGNITNNSSAAYLIYSSYTTCSISVLGVTHSGMEGKWVSGIVAGTAPKDTGRVLSNLSTL